jgi:hypothetical protein
MLSLTYLIQSHAYRNKPALLAVGSCPGGILKKRVRELNQVAPYDRLVPFGKRPTQFRHGDILQMPYSLSGHSECLSNFFESFRLSRRRHWSNSCGLTVFNPR